MANNKKKKGSSKSPSKKPAQLYQPTIPYVGNTPTLCLSIIVKNEANVILRMLETVAPILDHYVVVDTGSTDGTQDIIRNFFASKGIEGIVHDHPWVSFMDARNKALELARGRADFGLWIDADETMEYQPGFSPALFKRKLGGLDGANMLTCYGPQDYYRMQIFSLTKPWYWYGSLHECLICDEPSNVGVAQGLNTKVHPDGNSWTSMSHKEKYEGHAKILLDYVNNDPKKDPRWLFYLAQSYRDAGGPENLIESNKWYRARVDDESGYWEERYYAQYMIGQNALNLGLEWHVCLNEFLKAGKLNRHRIEHLMPIIKYYHDYLQDFETSYIYSSHAMKIAGKGVTPMAHSSLFIEKRAYEFDVLHYHMLNTWYSTRQQESKQTFSKISEQLKKGLVPADMIELTKSNAKYINA